LNVRVSTWTLIQTVDDDGGRDVGDYSRGEELLKRLNEKLGQLDTNVERTSGRLMGYGHG